jgi:hypothetical protein
LIEPCLIPKLLDYYKQLDDLTKDPDPEDYVNKYDLQSNDIFCLVFTLLVLCDRSFVKCFSYLASHPDALIKFDREMFNNLIGRFFLNISDDKNLVFVMKKLLNIEKFRNGKIKKRNTLTKR